jgi:hypothetical protein
MICQGYELHPRRRTFRHIENQFHGGFRQRFREDPTARVTPDNYSLKRFTFFQERLACLNSFVNLC